MITNIVKLDKIAVYDNIFRLKESKISTKNVIVEHTDGYINFQIQHDIINVKTECIQQFIETNNIRELEIRCDDCFDMIITTKVEELHVVGVHFNGIINWNGIMDCVRKGRVKRIVLTMSLFDAELPRFIELINIPSLVSVETRTPLLSDSQKNQILAELETNYHLLNFLVNVDKEKKDKIIERNISIRNDVIHFEVLEFAIVMSSIITYPYVLLEIFDWINWNYLANHVLKIRIIDNVCRFRRLLKGEE